MEDYFVEFLEKKEKQQFQPTLLNERVVTLDVIRGFSLLGILLVNMFGFYLPQPHIDMNNWFTDAIDIIWHQTLDIYVQSSFYPLFSMLFGYGMAMQFSKAEKLGTNYYNVATRRLAVLFAIGVLHAFLIWWGDILMMYAVCGLFLLLFIRFDSWIMATLGIAINLAFHFYYVSLMVAYGYATSPIEGQYVDLQTIENAITAYGVGGWTDAFNQRLDDLSVQMSFNMWISVLFTILPYMLIGAAASKWKLIERAKDLKLLWIILAVVGIGLGLFIKSTPYIFERTYLLNYLKVYIGGPILSIGYASAIVLICLIPFSKFLLKPIANAGRMALTLYIMQSIICSIIFYNFGFGLFGKVDVPLATYMAIGIFVAQVLFSELWFIKLKQGPLEWLTKKIIYRKINS